MSNASALRAAWEDVLRARIAPLLRSVLAGDDAPPALRCKAEGCAETGLALGLLDAADLAALLDTIYLETGGATIAERFGYPAEECIDSARERVTLPFAMPRAPVYPSGGTVADAQQHNRN